MYASGKAEIIADNVVLAFYKTTLLQLHARSWWKKRKKCEDKNRGNEDEEAVNQPYYFKMVVKWFSALAYHVTDG